ncbi:hypothetical protein Cantr_05869 [Candida viswanathii]|uniref:Uncharacterized protein n=1 Tax=Candida viswanathii TaxID=5486 RepID=A0A367XR45_9ASCO|nr:hypothetical protein Cantr_05869 [Candida viswanathii]
MTTITASPLTDVRVSHTKTRITESPLTDVTKIRISEVTIPTTTTTTRWIEVTPQLPTAAKSSPVTKPAIKRS